MKNLWLLLVYGLCFGPSAMAASETAFYFDQDKPGTAPHGLTSDGDAWRVTPDRQALSAPNVLMAPRSALSGGQAVILLANKSVFLNGDLGLRFRVLSEGTPAMIGLVWRYQNPDNFYALQMDTGSENIVLLKRALGKTKVLKSESTVITAPVWHTVQVQMIGRRIVVVFNGDTVIDVKDKSIVGPGQVGLQGSPGDAVQIDNFAYRPN